MAFPPTKHASDDKKPDSDWKHIVFPQKKDIPESSDDIKGWYHHVSHCPGKRWSLSDHGQPHDFVRQTTWFCAAKSHVPPRKLSRMDQMTFQDPSIPREPRSRSLAAVREAPDRPEPSYCTYVRTIRTARQARQGKRSRLSRVQRS